MSRAALQHAPQSSGKSAAATSLRVGPAHDSFEQEADQAAEKVTSGEHRQIAWSLSRVSLGMGWEPIQRQCSCGGTCDDCKKKKEVLQRNAASATAVGSYAPASVANTLSRPGSSIDPSTRSFMESRFGHDFSSVRIHTDDLAAASARDISANAYTVGSSIVFNQGKYQPYTCTGRKLLAHELAHVVQHAESVSGSSLGSSRVIARQAASEDEQMRSALKHAAASAADIETPKEFQQLKCVVQDACAQSVDGGVPTEATHKGPLNEKCRKETGFTGESVWPTPEQCAELKPGTLDVVSPGRLRQAKTLIQEYFSLLRANALRDDEVFGLDAALQEAEEKTGSLRPENEATPSPQNSPETPPPIVKGKGGVPVPPPSSLASASTVSLAPSAFSAAVRLLPAGAGEVALPGTLLAAGLIVTAYLVNDFLLRREAADAVEGLIGSFSFLRALTEEAIGSRVALRIGDKARGLTTQIVIHLARVLNSAVAGKPPDHQQDPERDKSHWWKEIKGFVKQILDLGLTRKQLLRELLREFSEEQLKEISDAMRRAAELLKEDPPDFPPTATP
jgi:hypothetical protein